MSKAIAERVVFGVVLMVAVVVLDFLLLQLAPGDVVDTILTEAGGVPPAVGRRPTIVQAGGTPALPGTPA